MDRRSFLRGLAASSAIAACPAAIEAAITAAPEVDFEVWFDQWMRDAAAVLADVLSDQIIYGVGAYERTDTYPYVCRIDPTLLELPTSRGGLFA